MSKKGLPWRFPMGGRGTRKIGFLGGPGGAPGAPWDKHPLGCIRGHSGVSRGVPIEPPGYPQNDRFRAELYLVYCRKRGGVGGTVYTHPYGYV